MATPPPESRPHSKPSPYRLPVVLGAAGVILLVLGFLMGWGWLALVGFLLILGAAYSVRLWFFYGLDTYIGLGQRA